MPICSNAFGGDFITSLLNEPCKHFSCRLSPSNKKLFCSFICYISWVFNSIMHNNHAPPDAWKSAFISWVALRPGTVSFAVMIRTEPSLTKIFSIDPSSFSIIAVEKFQDHFQTLHTQHQTRWNFAFPASTLFVSFGFSVPSHFKKITSLITINAPADQNKAGFKRLVVFPMAAELGRWMLF